MGKSKELFYHQWRVIEGNAKWAVIRLVLTSSAVSSAMYMLLNWVRNIPLDWRVMGVIFGVSTVGLVVASFLMLQVPAAPIKGVTPGNTEFVPLCHEHRANASELFRSAFVSGTDVYLLTIKSCNSFPKIDPLLESMSRGTKIHVLTWDPGSTTGAEKNPAIEALYRLTPQDPQTSLEIFTQEVLEARGKWQKRTGDYVKLGVYKSTPTLEGTLVKDKWAIVKTMPFRVSTDLRSAFIIEKDRSPDSFEYFQKAFINLWASAEK